MSKILFVANVDKEHIMKFHIPTIKVFKEHGWTVDVACAGPEDIPFCDRRFRTSWKRSPFTYKTFIGLHELKKIVNEGNYDIVYCHTPVGGLCARLASRNARKNGTKVIYCAHGLHFYKGAPLLNWLLYYPIEKWLSHFTDVFFTINNEDYDAVKQRFTKNKQMSVVLTNGVGSNFSRLDIDDPQTVRETYRRELGIAEDTTVLLYVAEIIKNKNQKMLVDTVKQLPCENYHLLLVGPEHDGGALRRYIDENGLSDRITLLGWRSDVGEWMAASDIYVASSKREGFAINLLEAMHCHLPVIATRNRGHIHTMINGENGFLVEIDDIATMATYIQQLANDKALYDRYANIDVSMYECGRVAQDLYNLIASL